MYDKGHTEFFACLILEASPLGKVITIERSMTVLGSAPPGRSQENSINLGKQRRATYEQFRDYV